MTPLIDVIFLLLLFFMLTSTFSKFSEVELVSGGSGAVAAPSDVPPIFLQVGPEVVTLNGSAVALDSLAADLRARASGETPHSVLISLKGEVSAQRLTDLLVILRQVPGLTLTVLGGGV